MKVTVTGATGLIGPRLVAALRDRGDEVTTLSRSDRPDAVRWADPEQTPAPAEAIEGRDAVVHLAGEPVAQRWSDDVKRRILSSRELGTRNLVAGIAAASSPPGVLVSSSGVGYYGARGDERLDESASPGEDFLAQVCVAWEREAAKAPGRVAMIRTGIVLDAKGGALEKMLPFFKLGIGGPVAGGRQYMPWIHIDDLVGLYVAALDGADWTGPVNGSAPEPVTNKEFSKTLGRVLKRPAVAPVPKLAIRTLYGEMAEIVTTGQRAIPARPLELGYSFRFTELEQALRDALDG
jgi:uncharacterized protein